MNDFFSLKNEQQNTMIYGSSLSFEKLVARMKNLQNRF
jgi:hypothetical protein